MILNFLMIIKNWSTSREQWNLSVLLVTFTMIIGNALLINFYQNHDLQLISNCMAFLIGPFLYFYISSKISRKVRVWPHLLPFVIYCLSQSLEAILILSTKFLTILNVFVFPAICTAQVFVYLLILLFLIKRIGSKKLKWIRVFVYVLTLIWLLNLPIWIIGKYITPISDDWLLLVASLFSMCIVWIFYRTVALQNMDTEAQNFHLHDLEKCLKVMDSYFEETKSFRDPKLDLKKLGKELNCDPRLISRSVNYLRNEQFREYVNKYRIRDVKDKLLNSENEHFSIAGIGQLAGFNSSSAFYSAFKKETGMTPVEFIKSR